MQELPADQPACPPVLLDLGAVLQVMIHVLSRNVCVVPQLHAAILSRLDVPIFMVRWRYPGPESSSRYSSMGSWLEFLRLADLRGVDPVELFASRFSSRSSDLSMALLNRSQSTARCFTSYCDFSVFVAGCTCSRTQLRRGSLQTAFCRLQLSSSVYI